MKVGFSVVFFIAVLSVILMLGLSIPITFDNFSETYKTRKDIREWNEAKINAYLIQSSIHDYLARNESLAELPVGKLNNHILLKNHCTF